MSIPVRTVRAGDRLPDGAVVKFAGCFLGRVIVVTTVGDREWKDGAKIVVEREVKS